MTVKPDCSNAIKALEDCLTKLGFWDDDSQVASLTVDKAWGDRVGISVAISEIEIPPCSKKPVRRETLSKDTFFQL